MYYGCPRYDAEIRVVRLPDFFEPSLLHGTTLDGVLDFFFFRYHQANRVQD